MKSQVGQLVRCTTLFFFPNLLSLSQRESYCTKLSILPGLNDNTLLDGRLCLSLTNILYLALLLLFGLIPID